MMSVESGECDSPLFTVAVVTCDDNQPLPCLGSPDPFQGSFLVGMAGVSYKVQICWDDQTDLGLCQFRLHLDGNFVGYTKVRDVQHGMGSYVEFDGFMVNKGETDTVRKVLEYRKFEFTDPSVPGQDAKYVVPPSDKLGQMSIEVFKFQEGSTTKQRNMKLWGSIASDGCGFAPLPECKKFFEGPSLATAPGGKFLKTSSFIQKRCPGRKVGPPIYQISIQYATAASLVRSGVLKSSVHGDIIQWALHQLPSYTDQKGSLTSEPSEPECVPGLGQTVEVIDLCAGEPVVYTYPVPSSIIDDLCDLTGNMAIWSRRPQCPHEMIDLTAEEDNLAQELVNRCLEGADDLEEVDMMDLDDYMESSRGF